MEGAILAIITGIAWIIAGSYQLGKAIDRYHKNNKDDN